MKAPQSPRVLPPAGTFPARVCNIIYLGTVKGEYKGVPNENYKVRITWELPTKTRVFKEGDKPMPFVVSKELTLSMGKKSSLRPLVEGMLGISFQDEEAKAFDIDELLGKACFLSIAHAESANGKYAMIKSTAELPEGMTCPPAVNPAKILSYEKFDKEYFMSLPNFLKEKMEKTPEFVRMNGGTVKDELDMSGETVDSESIPFD